MGHHCCRIRNGARFSGFQYAIALVIVFIATWQDHLTSGGVSVAAFTPATRQISKMKPGSPTIADSVPAATSNTNLLMASGKNKDDDQEISPVFWEDLDKKPGNLIMLPFVALVGIDLLLNIIFMTKRSFEFFVLGQAPSTETWFH